MKRLSMLAALGAVSMMTGCVSTYLNDETIGADGQTTKEVTFYRGGLATTTQFDTAEVNYQGVTAKVGGYSNKGDAELVKEISAGVVGGFIAYSTGGLGAVPSGVEAALKAYRAKAAATNDVEATSKPATQPSKPKPVMNAVKDSAADVAPGKYAVAIIGNRKGCGYCRSLWQPTFEADVEKALTNADVVDADLTDNPALYKKYKPTGAFVFPFAVVYGQDGKPVGSFTARGYDASGFAAQVSAICTAGNCTP